MDQLWICAQHFICTTYTHICVYTLWAQQPQILMFKSIVCSEEPVRESCRLCSSTLSKKGEQTSLWCWFVFYSHFSPAEHWESTLSWSSHSAERIERAVHQAGTESDTWGCKQETSRAAHPKQSAWSHSYWILSVMDHWPAILSCMGQENIVEEQEFHLTEREKIFLVQYSHNITQNQSQVSLTACSELSVLLEGIRGLTKPWLMKYSVK